MENTTQTNEEIEKINAEIFSHMANPRNYGEMKNPDGVGKSLNEITEEFLMVFIKINDKKHNQFFGCCFS